MALSVFLAILPFLFLNQRWFFVISVVSLFLVFELYQTSAMIYPAMLACVLIKENIESKQVVNLKLLVVSSTAFVVALVMFKLLFSIENADVVRGKVMPLNMDNIHLLLNKADGFRKLLASVFYERSFKRVSALFFVMSVLAYLAFMIRSKKNVVHALAIGVYFGALIFFSMLPDLVLDTK